MLITLICAAVLVVGIVSFIVNYKVFYDDVNLLYIIGVTFSVLGVIGVLCCGTLLITENINPELKYRKDEIEYEILQEQVDNGEYNSTTLTSNIISYNQKVTDYKERYDSPWVGWFYYEGCEKLPFVVVKGDEKCSEN